MSTPAQRHHAGTRGAAASGARLPGGSEVLGSCDGLQGCATLDWQWTLQGMLRASHRAELQQDVALVADDLAGRLLRLRGTQVRGDSLRAARELHLALMAARLMDNLLKRRPCGRSGGKAVALMQCMLYELLSACDIVSGTAIATRCRRNRVGGGWRGATIRVVCMTSTGSSLLSEWSLACRQRTKPMHQAASGKSDDRTFAARVGAAPLPNIANGFEEAPPPGLSARGLSEISASAMMQVHESPNASSRFRAQRRGSSEECELAFLDYANANFWLLHCNALICS